MSLKESLPKITSKVAFETADKAWILAGIITAERVVNQPSFAGVIYGTVGISIFWLSGILISERIRQEASLKGYRVDSPRLSEVIRKPITAFLNSFRR